MSPLIHDWLSVDLNNSGSPLWPPPFGMGAQHKLSRGATNKSDWTKGYLRNGQSKENRLSATRRARFAGLTVHWHTQAQHTRRESLRRFFGCVEKGEEKKIYTRPPPDCFACLYKGNAREQSLLVVCTAFVWRRSRDGVTTDFSPLFFQPTSLEVTPMDGNQ